MKLRFTKCPTLQEKFTTIVILLVMVSGLVYINSGVAEERIGFAAADYVGNWSGKTSQGFPISLKIEDRRGKAVVTQLKYKITLNGLAWGWDKTTDIQTPLVISAEVIDGKFMFNGEFETSRIQFSGNFVNASLLNGVLKESDVYPVNIVTATGVVTYEANKE